MNHPTSDLHECDKEPIHILGKVQAHGFLVAVDKNQSVAYISENIGQFIDAAARAYLGRPVKELEKVLNRCISGPALNFSHLISLGNDNSGFAAHNPFFLELGQKPFNLVISISGNYHLFEFEPAADEKFDPHRTLGSAISEIFLNRKILPLLETVAMEIKKIIVFDRVMIYQFGEDGHGEVIAEEKNDDLPPFLGLHYPASDIPVQARELYKVNLVRLIADVSSESSAIITCVDGAPALDLTHSVLRAISPAHILYLKNMGVASSFSVSLMAHGELWGLIACHNYTPALIGFQARNAAKLIGQVLSPALEHIQVEEDMLKFNVLNEAANRLLNYIEKEDNIYDALMEHEFTIKDITTAAGAVLVYENKITSIGVTPNEIQIKEIVTWIKENIQESIYHTDNFPQVFLPAAEYSQLACGILVCVFSKELNELLIWFKPEEISTVNWAGDPGKPMGNNANGTPSISPRESFAIWTETIKNKSEKWSNTEVALAIKLRDKIIYTLNKKANEIRVLNEKLKLAYEELDTFSYTIAHDLRTPLSSIRSYMDVLLITGKDFDERTKQILQLISGTAGKMGILIKEVLHHSQVGRQEIGYTAIDMTAMVQEIKKEVTDAFNARDILFTVGETPAIQGDPVMIYQVFSNLITNAVKYSSKSTPSKVHVEGSINKEQQIIYTVSDNGIGMPPQQNEEAFRLFKRLDNVQGFDGTGVGLAIVKRILDKHLATIWIESELGVGSVIYISFKS